MFVPHTTTIYADVAETLFESIKVNGELCNSSLDFSFDQIAQVNRSSKENC